MAPITSPFMDVLRSGGGQLDVRALTVLTAALCIFVAPLDLTQLLFGLVGALAYALWQAAPVPDFGPRPLSGKTVDDDDSAPCKRVRAVQGRPKAASPAAAAAKSGAARFAATPPAQGPLVRQPSSQPVQSLRFDAEGYEAEVRELAARLAPTSATEQAVERLAAAVRAVVVRMVPEAEVLGFASCELQRGTPFGVAVPDVDVVVNADPRVLAQLFQNKRQAQAFEQTDLRKVQKAALRTFTDRLIASGAFKFRRSAFRGDEPKVTLLAAASAGAFSESIPIDFSINCATPLYNAALLMECGQVDARAKELILLVRRWAKDRGICHAPKGHLSPYAWTLLTIFFLQVGPQAPLLPPLDGLRASSSLVSRAPSTAAAPAAAPAPAAPVAAPSALPGASVAALFRDFVDFYQSTFEWSKEAASIRRGGRGPPDAELPVGVVLDEASGRAVAAPSVEDPFCPGCNLGAQATKASLERLHFELHRAKQLLSKDASLAELLEPWAPPERADGEEGSAP